jgi:cell division septal protein FtsQ
MSRSGKVVDLRKGSPRDQAPLFSPRTWLEPESPKRPTPLRVKRRKMRAIAALLVLLVIAGIVWGISWASYLPQFSVNSISVAGARDTPQQLIQNYVGTILNDGSHPMFSRSNILLYPRADIQKAVENFFPRIKSVSISRESFLATAIMIAVEERKPFAQWCNPAGVCFVMDDSGFIFADGADNNGDSISTMRYIFRGGIASSTNPVGQRFAPAHLPGILALLEFLSEAGFNPHGGTIDNDQDFLVPFTEGFTLKVSFGQEAHALAKNLELVLSSAPLKGKESQLEYIDLRFDNRVYYKLKGEMETSSADR